MSQCWAVLFTIKEGPTTTRLLGLRGSSVVIIIYLKAVAPQFDDIWNSRRHVSKVGEHLPDGTIAKSVVEEDPIGIRNMYKKYGRGASLRVCRFGKRATLNLTCNITALVDWVRCT